MAVGTGYYSMTTQAQVAVGAARCKSLPVSQLEHEADIVYTNRNASGIVRGFGGQELKCTLIPLLSLAMDGRSILSSSSRRTMSSRAEATFGGTANGTHTGASTISGHGRRPEGFGWKEKWKGWLKPSATKGKRRRGVGVGVHGDADIGEDASEAHVRIHPDGTAMLFSCVTSMGPAKRATCQDGGRGASGPARTGIADASRYTRQSLRIRAGGIEGDLCHRLRGDQGGGGREEQAPRVHGPYAGG